MSDSAVPTIDLFHLGAKGLQHHGLRRANERAVLTVVGFNPGLSNAEIARMSGLAPQTVSAILNDVEAAGLIMRGEVLRGRRGQPATPIFIKPEGAYSIGVEIGWRHADVLAIDLGGAVVAQRHLDYAEADLAALAPQLALLIAELIRDWPEEQRARLADIGVGMPGSIHAATWPLEQEAGSKSGPSPAAFAADLEQRTGLAVTLFNDGNAACWAELLAQPAPRPASFIYLLVSTYLAAGLIGEGRLWQGPTGHSADLGAILVGRNDKGPLSAHAIASVSALVERLGAAGIAADFAAIETWDWPALEPVVGPWLEDCAEALALVVFNTNAVVEASLVVLDTILPAAITARLVERLAVHFERLPARRRVSIAAGHVGRRAPALGAAELPLYHRFFARNLLDKPRE
ncbi:MAG TPA: ROK family transcriptional regulator [Devosia sp.]|nr:ROK family transcriptional regulator [Devosia sp.]